MKFEIHYDSQPTKFLKKQDNQNTIRIINKIEIILLNNPVPHDAKRIIGKNIFRIRIGKWRVLYRINHTENKIIIIKIDKREKVY